MLLYIKKHIPQPPKMASFGSNLATALWVVLILLLILLLVALIWAFVVSFSTPEGLDGQFRITKYATTHLEAGEIDIAIKMVYKNENNRDRVPTYTDVLTTVDGVMTAASFGPKAKWVKVAEDLAKQLDTNNATHGVLVQLYIHRDGDRVETANFKLGFVSGFGRFNATIDEAHVH